MQIQGRFPWFIGLIVILLVSPVFTPQQASAASTTLRESAFSLPHFYGDTNAELARENGREIAKDRLVQMILLARVGRGTLAQALGILDPGLIDDDIDTRRTGYTSSELNNMYAKLPQSLQDQLLDYCRGVNDTIEAIYAGTLPEPLEINILRNLIGIGDDLFGNATDISDGVDPFYKAPGGADPNRPNAGFQYTPEVLMSIVVLQVSQFGLESFNEAARLGELQNLIAKHGASTGEEIWLDRNFLNDPLAPVSVPDPNTPGFGGPLAALPQSKPTLLASAKSPSVAIAKRYPRYDYIGAEARRQAAHERRAERARKLGAWPQLGSYSWVIAANRSATGNPWLGGFPQTGIQTPSVMHFAENRSGEGIQGNGMEFAGFAVILIGQTDTVAWTSTTAQLRVVDTFFEVIIGEDADAIRYDDEGAEALLSQRTEIFRDPLSSDTSHVFWRSHERSGNGGSRPILDFQGDAEGTAESGDPNSIVDNNASFSGAFVGGHVAIVDGTGAGQIRAISAVPSGTELVVGSAWTTLPDDTSVYVATESGDDIIAVASDSVVWLEETTTVLGFARFQQSTNVLDVRKGVRLMPSTHNFPSADNQTFNGIGTNGGSGNISYYSSGFSRKRQGATDAEKLLPIDGTDSSNPLIVLSGTVTGADPNTLGSTGAFTGEDFSPEAINFRYQNTSQQGSDFIVSITGGTGYKQTRRIASNDNDTLQVEFPWGVTPGAGDTFEIYEIVAMPEVINPSEGYFANWNNKAATADDGDGFGRNHRTAFISERLAADSSWDRAKQRQLNKDVAGLDSKGAFGRYLVPRLRDAVDAVGNGGNPDVDTVLAELEAHNGSPALGREFIDPVSDLKTFGEVNFLENLIVQLANDIYGDEYSGAISVPGGTDGLSIVLHAIDSAAGDVPGSYTQKYAGDYFNGTGWETVVRDGLSALASGGIPADPDRPRRSYNHPLSALFSELRFPQTLAGNRGTWEQIVEVGPVVNGEFIFPLGQSGHLEGSLDGITFIDPHNTSLHPIWARWAFVPMLHVSQDLAGGGDGDADNDGALDGFERWYFGDTSTAGDDDGDADGATLAQESAAGTDPTDSDTDDDGILDGQEIEAGGNPLDAESQVQSKDQQQCIVTLNQGLASVAKAQAKDICTCIKAATKGKLSGQTLEQCMTADNKGKVAKARSKLDKKRAGKCLQDDFPSFGVNDPNQVDAIAVAKELSLIHEIFGSDLDAVIIQSDDPNRVDPKTDGKCQLTAAKETKKCQDEKLKQFIKCKKSGLKDKSIQSAADLAACMGLDPKGKIDKACNTKLLGKLDKACTGLDLTALFPGDCSGAADTTALKDCLDRLVECAVCTALNQADGLNRDCDLFDDGTANDSCD